PTIQRGGRWPGGIPSARPHHPPQAGRRDETCGLGAGGPGGARQPGQATGGSARTLGGISYVGLRQAEPQPSAIRVPAISTISPTTTPASRERRRRKNAGRLAPIASRRTKVGTPASDPGGYKINLAMTAARTAVATALTQTKSCDPSSILRA